MADPIGTFSGLSSGIQWRDMVDQIMRIEQQRRFDPVASRQSVLSAQADAWKQLQSVVAGFRDAARVLRDMSAFDLFSASATKSTATGRELVAVSAGTGAAPGNYSVEVLATARAEKIAGAIVADTATPMGVAGTFALNGRAIVVTADDTLASVRDKINNANSGTSPSGVSATILSAAGGARLVLTSDATGAGGIESIDDGSGLLQTLGFSDGTTTANIAASGATQTNRLSSATAAIATVLGVPLPTPSTIRVGGYTISVDLSVDSLTTVAARINAATGTTSARVEAERTGSTTTYRLVTDAAVEVDGAAPAESSAMLAALGFTRHGRGDVAQRIASANAFVDAGTSLAATGATLLTDLQVNGQSLGVVNGDTITIGGKRGDGTAVTHTFVVTGTSTLQDLLAAIGDGAAGFGAGTRTASASVVDGRVTLSDAIAGDSQLALQLSVTHAGGSTVSLGGFSTANGGEAGRSRQVIAGADALVRVDGQLVRRSANTITDAIPGVTLTALAAEVGATANISISRDADAAAKAVQTFVAAYNAVRAFVTKNSAAGGALANSTALRSMGATLTTQLLQPMAGLTGTLTSAALAGVQHDRNGVLSVDVAVFKAALKTNFGDVQRLFASTGATTDPELSFVGGTDATTPSASPYDVVITQAATYAEVTGASWTTYATAGSPDTISITDAATGAVANILLTDGDGIGSVIDRMNTEFATQKMQMRAERTADDRVRLVSTAHGTVGGFSVAFTPGDADGTAQLGLAAQSYAGLDVAGTINGVAATGKGQILTGAAASAAEGLSVQYTGTTARAAGTVSFALGVGGVLFRAASAIAADSSGAAFTQETSVRAQAEALNARLIDIQLRLDARRDALIRQFVAMEGALAQAQSLGAVLTAQLSALQPRN